MDVSSIPKSFWHAVSVCMVAATFGLLYIAYNSSSVSIEIANTKIELLSALAETKDIQQKLEAKSERLNKISEDLKKGANALEERASSSPEKGLLTEEISKFRELARETSGMEGLGVPSQKFKALDMQIRSLRQSLAK